MAARRFRIEVSQGWPSGGLRVSCSPVEYLDRDEFKTWLKTCRKRFMDLTSKWVMERAFADKAEARQFAAALASLLDEPLFLCLGVATPCKVPVDAFDA